MGLFSGLKHNTPDYNIGDIPVSFGEGFGETFSSAVGSTTGDLLQAARNKFDDSPLIDFQQARHLADKEGVSVTVPSTGIRQDTLTALIKRKHEQAATASVMSRAPGGFMAQAGYFTAGLAGGLLDPLEFGSNFVPVVGQARKAKMLADAGAGVFSRMGARAQIGMAEGAAGSLLLEPFVYGSKTYLQDDYTSWDSMLNIGLGTAVGGGLHAVGGAGVDAWRKYRVTPDVNTAPPPGAQAYAQAYGADTQIKIGDQYEPAKWALVDASVVEATMGKADNQFRDRTRVASDAQVNDIANKIDFAMLSDSPVMDYGAPTLSLDGRVVGGNGRLAAISRAYDIGKGADYSGPLTAKLAELGIDPAALQGMSKPALVRVLQGDVDVRQAAILSNEGGAMKMSALEQAKVDAERLGDMRLEMGENGDLNNASNRAAIRKWVEAQPVNQRNALMDADGMLSAEGLQRLRNSVLFKAYGDSPTLARLIEAVDPGSRNVANALMRSSGVVADAEARIRAGELHPVSLVDDIRLAVEKYAQLKQDGATVRDYLDQLDAFGDGMTPESRSLLAFMGDNIASPRRMAEAVQGFYRQLDEAGNPGQGDMFGGSGAPDKAAMLARAIDEAGKVETSAAELASTVSPQTREAALNTAVAQSVAGIDVDVDAMVRADPAIGQAGETEIRNAATRAQKPEADALADFAASEAVQERVDLAPKSLGLIEAEAAASEAASLLSDVMKAGDQAFKYARGKVTDDVKKENFKRWSNDAPLVTSTDADTYAFKTGEKVVVEAFHGTKRPDRVGTKFLKKRATSGPMAYHTSSPVLASSYATGKQDTSLADEDNNYANWFKWVPPGSRSPVDIVRAWNFLDADAKAKISEIAPTLRLSDDLEHVVSEVGNKGGNGSYDYNLQQTQRGYDKRGNPLKALVEDWLNSGNLFDNEELFMEVLQKAGFPVKDVAYDSPYAEWPAVYKNFIAMQKPLVTSDIPQEVVDALDAAAAKDRSKPQAVGADAWDKNTKTLKMWVEAFHEADNKYVWTSLPDKVTDVFRSLGYDGIVDWSGKGGGTEYPVYIPFEETQVKSAIGNRGTYDQAKNDILYARGIPPEQASEFLTASIRASFGASTERLLESGNVKIVSTPDDLPARSDGAKHPGDVKGWAHPDGTAYIVASNVSEKQARGMLLHEVGVHVGMERMLGADVFQSVLKELDDAIMRGEDWAQAARDRVPEDTAVGLVREEQLAYLVENAPELPLVQRIIAAVRAWAYRTFEFARERITLGEADFQAMAVAALHHAARGEGQGVLAGAYGRAATATAAFKKWFGESKVVGADGEPLVVYHGTRTGGFNTFKPNTRKGEQLGFGIHFAIDEGFASKYADDDTVARKGKTPQIYATYLKASKPLLADAIVAEGTPEFALAKKLAGSKLFTMKDENGILTAYMQNAIDATNPQRAEKLIREAGYDAVRYVSKVGTQGVGAHISAKSQSWIVFDPTQIKSATGNRGTFDPTNPDIRYSRGETPDPTDADAPVKKADEQVKRAKDFGKALRAAADKLDNDAAATAAMRASMPDITATEIDELLGQLRKQVKGLRGSARSMRAQVTAPDTAADLQTDAMKAADTLANNIEMDSTIEKRNVALNIAARMRASSFLGQFFGHGKLDVEGFRALLVGSERKRTGGRLSVDAEQKGYRGEWMGGLTADMRKADVWDLFVGGTMDREASQALFLMGDKNADLSALPKEAVEIARVIEKYQTDARMTRNRFGAWIRDAKGYIVRQAHDMIKIREAGAEAWVAYVMPRLDLDKMIEYGLISDKDVMGSLQAMWSDFAAGRHMAVSLDPEQSAALKGASLARRESASRTLFFKDGYAFHEYNTKFGQGRLAEAVVSGLDNAAKAAGLLKVLGTNPEAMIKALADEYEASLTGDPKRRAKFAQARGEIDNMLKTVDGRINIPGSYMGARISAGARAVSSMAKLGGVLISSITDPLIYAADLRSVRGTNLLSGMMEAIGGLTNGRGTSEQKAILSQLGVFSESMTGGVFARFDSPDLIGGKMSAAMQLFFKANGLTWWTETLRNSYALSHSHYLADQSGKGFDKLDAGTADMLRLYNIDAGKWDILRMAGLQMADGRKYMTPEGLNTVPRAAFENYITNVGRTVSDASVQNLRDDLGQALRTMTIDRMHHAVIEPGARTRAFMTRGTQPGTVPGEFLRFIGQFKSFPVAFMQMTVGREIYGKGYDTMSDYLKNGKGDMLGLASFIGMTIGMGYIAMSAKDMLKGKNPRPVDDWRTWAAAAVQGGGLGLYGDFLFGKFSRTGGTLSSSLGGPVIGSVDTVADLWTKIKSGDDVAASAFQAALSNTPFMNLFYTRIMLDYLIIYQIQEALNPGFLRRMEGRVQREHGQTYMFPPSQYANR